MKTLRYILFITLLIAFRIEKINSQDSIALLKFDSLTQVLEKKIETWEKVFSSESKTTGELSNIISIAGVIITIFLATLILISYQSRSELKGEYIELRGKVKNAIKTLSRSKKDIALLESTIEDMKEKTKDIDQKYEKLNHLKNDVEQLISQYQIPKYPGFVVDLPKKLTHSEIAKISIYYILGFQLTDFSYRLIAIYYFEKNNYTLAIEYLVKISNQNIHDKNLLARCFVFNNDKARAKSIFYSILDEDVLYLKTHYELCLLHEEVSYGYLKIESLSEQELIRLLVQEIIKSIENPNYYEDIPVINETEDINQNGDKTNQDSLVDKIRDRLMDTSLKNDNFIQCINLLFEILHSSKIGIKDINLIDKLTLILVHDLNGRIDLRLIPIEYHEQLKEIFTEQNYLYYI